MFRDTSLICMSSHPVLEMQWALCSYLADGSAGLANGSQNDFTPIIPVDHVEPCWTPAPVSFWRLPKAAFGARQRRANTSRGQFDVNGPMFFLMLYRDVNWPKIMLTSAVLIWMNNIPVYICNIIAFGHVQTTVSIDKTNQGHGVKTCQWGRVKQYQSTVRDLSKSPSKHIFFWTIPRITFLEITARFLVQILNLTSIHSSHHVCRLITNAYHLCWCLKPQLGCSTHMSIMSVDLTAFLAG